MSKKTKAKTPSRIIADNRKSRHDYFIEKKIEAGLVLEGWEVKSLRENRVQLKESYVVIKKGEAWLIGAHISALNTCSTHITPDPVRSRKLLLHRNELNKLQAAVSQKGYTVVPLNLHWTKNRAKLEIALAKGKQQQDKRQTIKERDWQREKAKVLKHSTR